METNDAVQVVTASVAEPIPAEQSSVSKPSEKVEPKKDAPKVDSAEVEKLKQALSKANSEAAEYRRALREKQTEAERAEAERAEADKAMREELETLRKEKAVSEYKSKCLALDFDADLAAQTATAIADGNFESLFDCLKQFVEATKTKMANDALNRQPGLSAGVPPTTNTTQDTEYEQMRRWAGLPPRK